MKLTPYRVLRFLLGVLLPVPLFVAFYYSSYFYRTYHGFDHETNTYLPNQQSIELERQHLVTDFLFFLMGGFFLMGIPCVVYSLLLERYRTTPRFTPISYTVFGVLVGGLAGILAVQFGIFGQDIRGTLQVVLASSCVGGIIPLLLLLIGPKHASGSEENKQTKASSLEP